MTAFQIRCRCGTKLRATAAAIGKKARCKKCGSVFKVPRPDQSAKFSSKRDTGIESQTDRIESQTDRIESPSNSPQDQEYRLAPPDGPKTPAALPKLRAAQLNPNMKRCQSCKRGLNSGTVVCLHCGYHSKLKRKMQVVDEEGIIKSQSQIAIIAYNLAVLFVLASCFLHQMMDGPTYLIYFFVCYCLIGLATLAARKLLQDIDTFNYAAMIALGGMGMFRIFDAVIHGRFKFAFLVMGIAISIFVLAISLTQANTSKDAPLARREGGLSVFGFLLFYGIGVFLMASIYFVPPISEAVAKVGFSLSVIFSFVLSGMWAVATGNMDTDSLMRSGSHSCSSGCGGGGGCGGGCGGCGG